MTVNIIEPTETYNKIITDLIEDFNGELKVYKSEMIDATTALDMGIYSEIYIFDEILDTDKDFVSRAREVNDKIGFIVVSAGGRSITEISNQYNLSEDAILIKPFVFSRFEKALNMALKQ